MESDCRLVAVRYTAGRAMRMIIEDPGVRQLHENADFRDRRFGSGVQRAIRRLLALVEEVPRQRDLYQFRSVRLERLRGDRAGQYSMRVNDQFRLITRFEAMPDGQTCIVIEVVDYQ